MRKSDLNAFTKKIKFNIAKRSPEILTGLGVAGMLTTTVIAVRATPKALRLIEEAKEKKQLQYLSMINEDENSITVNNDIVNLSPKEIVMSCWKCYSPAVVLGAISTVCLIGANSVSMRRTAALATAYKLSETALSEYRDAVVETIGEKKEKIVKDKVAKEHIDHDPVTNKEVYITNKGETLCYDTLSGRYFKSNIDSIKKAENILNQRMIKDMYISLNEFYYELGLESTRLGNDLGWNTDDGLIELDFSSQLAVDGTPCLVMDYNIAPKYDYSRLEY